MPATRFKHRLATPSICVVFGLVVGLGCRPQEGIRTYETTKTQPPQAISQAFPASAVTPPSDRGEKTHRMLALITPGGGQAWFFKLVGAIEDLQPLAEQVVGFYRGVSISDDGKPRWDLPEGWRASPPAGMRLTTITVAEGLEISVIGLPIAGDWEAQVLDNVNRWRGQLGLSATDAEDLAEETSKVEGVDGAVIVDSKGWYSGGMAPGGGVKPPFAGFSRPAGRPTGNPSGQALPPSVVQRQAEPVAVDFETPGGWVELSPTSMRKINLQTGEGPDAASVRASRWRAAGRMGDPTENVNRWRRMAGLTPMSAEEVLAGAEAIRVDGQPAQLFTVNLPPERTSAGSENPALATVVAMLKRGGEVWFFLITGPAETVAGERPTYEQWLASIRFPGQEEGEQPKYQKPPTDRGLGEPAQEPANGDR